MKLYLLKEIIAKFVMTSKDIIRNKYHHIRFKNPVKFAVFKIVYNATLNNIIRKIVTIVNLVTIYPKILNKVNAYPAFQIVNTV